MDPTRHQEQTEQQEAPAKLLSPLHSEPQSRGQSPSSCSSDLDQEEMVANRSNITHTTTAPITSATKLNACKIATYDEEELNELDEDGCDISSNGARRSSAASFAQQYLLQRTSCMMNSGGSGKSGGGCAHLVGKHKRKVKQLLQSIPMPHLVATSIITVIMLCLLISECKSLQLLGGESQERGQQRVDTVNNIVDDEMMARGSNAMALKEQQQQQQVNSNEPLAAQESQVRSAGDQVIVVESSNQRVRPPLQRRHHRQRLLVLDTAPVHSRRQTAGEAEMQQAFQQQQAGLRREILNELMQQQQHHQQQQQQKRRSQPPAGEVLASLLAAGGSASDSDQSAAPAESAGEQLIQQQHVAADERLVGDGLPMAHLRNSPVDLIDLSGHNSHNHNHNHQQQQQANQHNHRNSENKFRQAAAFHQNQQQQTFASKPSSPDSDNSDSNDDQQQQTTADNTRQAYLSSMSDRFREFDVPQIQCNNTEEGFERFACPTPDEHGYRCLEDRAFCDGYYDCPGGEDEDRMSCMFYKLFVSHIDILTNTFLTWMKKQNRQMNHRSLDMGMGAGIQ